MCFVLLAFAVPPAFGQAFGSISGEVTDPSAAEVPGATVTATETGTGFARAVTSDATGHYIIPNLRPTQYTLTVVAGGFKKAVREDVTLLANQAVTLDFRLELGSTLQSVMVSGRAALVNTTTQTLRDVITADRVVDLPLNGRNAIQLMSLVPGVSGIGVATVAGQSTLPGATNVNIHGSRNNQTSYSLDGANFLDQYCNVNIPFPMPDALEVFSIQTNNYSARYGINAGGVVNVVTKSGTNTLHGDMFEFVRNPVLNARNFFSVNRDKIKRNDFGGTVGGPIVIPHV
jgi:Carboxypeptidase regulatory-like domain/TonB-dependent Receptor Plug Domain